MPWYLTDDGFSTYAKVMAIPRRHRCAAVGLHRMAGSWSAKELTDGFIPAHMISEFAGSKGMVDQLVDAGLWERVPGGYQDVDWFATSQPVRDKVEAERAAARRRMERNRANKKGVGSGDVRPNNGRTDARGFDDWHATEPPPELDRRSVEARPSTTLDTVAEASSQVDEAVDSDVRPNFGRSSDSHAMPSHTNSGDLGGNRSVSSPRATRIDPPSGSQPESNSAPISNTCPEHPDGWVTGCERCYDDRTERTRRAAEGIAEGRGRAPATPPAPTCPDHETNSPVNCHRCKHDRLARAEWDAEQLALAEADRAAEQAAARATALADRDRRAAEIAEQEIRELAAISACGMCDDAGFNGPHVCDHEHDQVDTNARGRAAAWAAFGGRRPTTRRGRLAVVPDPPATTVPPTDPDVAEAANA